MSRTMMIGRAEGTAGGKSSRANGAANLPDGVLLDRFVTDRDASAFETLLLRHGPSVLGICRRRLGDGQEAEDAYQETFIILVARAGEIRQVECVGGWLCGVARRVAGRARMRADRRRVCEGVGTVADVRDAAAPDEAMPDDLPPIVRAEVDRLPEKYRRPIELCYWEGLSSDQAAARLDCPTGTLKWRLSRAREILRGRLVRLGIALTALLMWRPSTARAGTFLPLGLTGRAAAEGAGPSADLVRETLVLASRVRDLSFVAKRRESRAPVGIPIRPRPAWLGYLSLIVLVAFLLFGPVVRTLRSATSPTYFPWQTPTRSCH